MPFNFFSSSRLLMAIVLSTAFISTSGAIASTAPKVSPTESSGESLSQVPSVDQLSDVQPSDWAFSALQSLVERYGCIVGYPNRTYQGNRALSRYEFAAGLSACLDRVNELIASSTADTVSKADLETIRNCSRG